VALGTKGVLILGDSGAGKSDLALRLIEDGARLVADDRAELFLKGGALCARPPPRLAGLIEIRGLGIVRLPYRRQVKIALAVRLGQAAPRLPERTEFVHKKAVVPLIAMEGREASAPAKIRLALTAFQRGLFTETVI
jgi:hypothetical protein